MTRKRKILLVLLTPPVLLLLLIFVPVVHEVQIHFRYDGDPVVKEACAYGTWKKESPFHYEEGDPHDLYVAILNNRGETGLTFIVQDAQGRTLAQQDGVSGSIRDDRATVFSVNGIK